MNESDGQETPRRQNPITWPVRFLLHWSVKSVVLLFMGVAFVLRPRAVRYGLVALLLVGAVGWNFAAPSLKVAAGNPLAPASAAQSASISTASPSGQLPQSAVVQQYLQAQAGFNGKGMWDLLSDDMKNTIQQSSGATVDQLQSELDTAKQQGRRYSGATYVGGVPIAGGQRVYFYVVTVDTPSGSTEVPYIYVVGSDGKIASIQ
jgi:hypothetical protein